MHPRIHSDPAIMMGKPVIKGTRITVQHILGHLGNGRSIDDLLEAYPHLSRDDILAALLFAGDYMASEVFAYKTLAAE